MNFYYFSGDFLFCGSGVILWRQILVIGKIWLLVISYYYLFCYFVVLAFRDSFPPIAASQFGGANHQLWPRTKSSILIRRMLKGRCHRPTWKRRVRQWVRQGYLAVLERTPAAQGRRAVPTEWMSAPNCGGQTNTGHLSLSCSRALQLKRCRCKTESRCSRWELPLRKRRMLKGRCHRPTWKRRVRQWVRQGYLAVLERTPAAQGRRAVPTEWMSAPNCGGQTNTGHFSLSCSRALQLKRCRCKTESRCSRWELPLRKRRMLKGRCHRPTWKRRVRQWVRQGYLAVLERTPAAQGRRAVPTEWMSAPNCGGQTNTGHFSLSCSRALQLKRCRCKTESRCSRWELPLRKRRTLSGRRHQPTWKRRVRRWVRQGCLAVLEGTPAAQGRRAVPTEWMSFQSHCSTSAVRSIDPLLSEIFEWKKAGHQMLLATARFRLSNSKAVWLWFAATALLTFTAFQFQFHSISNFSNSFLKKTILIFDIFWFWFTF